MWLKQIPQRSTYQGGFTLLEILIALLVLSIGLLGMAGLQATSLRNSHDAYVTTRATYLAHDMADRMRANRSALATYTGLSGVSHDCVTVSCSPTDIAENDISEWLAEVQTLPGGQGNIVQAGSLFTITVMWDELRNGATGVGCDPNNPTDMRCVSIITQP